MICIPVRNEATELPGLFGALERLERIDHRPVGVCLLLDGCTDASGALATIYQRRSLHRVLIGQVAPAPSNAGRARHLAMMLGVDALAGHEGHLLSTDADSRPSVDWLRTMTAALMQAEVVTGRIVRDKTRLSPFQDRIETYYDALFALRRHLDPVPWEACATHHYTGGANMGMRSGAYSALGGFLPLAGGEDARLVDDAARAGLRVRRDAASLVHTSDRRDGRALEGLAKSLGDLDSGDVDEIQVGHPADAAWQYRMHAAARAAFDEDRLAPFSALIGLSHDHARGVARDCPNAEAFAMRIVPMPPGGMRTVSFPVSEQALAALTGTLGTRTSYQVALNAAVYQRRDAPASHPDPAQS